MKNTTRNNILTMALVLCLAWTGAHTAVAQEQSSQPIRLSEPVTSDADSETFGAALNESLPKKKPGDVIC